MNKVIVQQRVCRVEIVERDHQILGAQLISLPHIIYLQLMLLLGKYRFFQKISTRLIQSIKLHSFCHYSIFNGISGNQWNGQSSLFQSAFLPLLTKCLSQPLGSSEGIVIQSQIYPKIFLLLLHLALPFTRYRAEK